MKENAQFAKLLELMWNSHTALPLHGCLISQSQLPQMYCSFCTLAGFPTQVFMHMQDNTKTCASNTFPQFSFIITRKLLIKHCFGIWKTHLDSLMSTLSSFFPFWNSYMAFPSAMYGSSFGNKKKPCDMKQTCGGLSTLGRNYIYYYYWSVCWGWYGGALLLHILPGHYALLIPFPYLTSCTHTPTNSVWAQSHILSTTPFWLNCVGKYSFMLCHCFTCMCWWGCLLSTLWLM